MLKPSARAPWFKVRNFFAPGGVKTGEITLRGYIGESQMGGFDFDDGEYEEGGAGTVKELEQQISWLGDVDEIQLLVSSEGGNIFDALAIADMLNRSPAKIIGTVEGYAFSAATVILAQCADEIRMASNAFQMIHEAEGDFSGGPAQAQQALDILNKTSDAIAGIYAARGTGTAEQFRAMMGNGGRYLTGIECKACGLADTITDEVVLTNYRPVAKIRNAASREKMPAALRAIFDNPPPANPTEIHPDDMKPEEIKALVSTEIINATNPLREENTKLRGEITTAVENAIKPLREENTKLRGEITTAVENATKPLRDENAALRLEIENVRKLHGNGVLGASQGTPPIENAGAAGGSEEVVHATPRARMIAALENCSAFKKKIAPAA